MKYVAWLALALSFGSLVGLQRASAQNGAQPAALRYLSPRAGAQFVPAGTTLTLRLDGPIDPATLSRAAFTALGSISGPHTAVAVLADDGSTVVFKPQKPFTLGEGVTVTLGGGLAETNGARFAGAQTQFNISAGQPTGIRIPLDEEDPPAGLNASTPVKAPTNTGAVAVNPQNFVTFPHDFPIYTVTVPASGTAPGLLFMAPLKLDGTARNFLFIADDSGQPVFWQPAGITGFDFKVQPDGSLTYIDLSDNLFHVYDTTYSQTRTIGAANGYLADIHDLQILPNGHSLLLVYDSEITSTLEFGGYLTATVTGLIIQELDASGLPVFQWDSWSHIPISDTMVPLTTTVVDYVHGNAIELDHDGNWLLSGRHLSAITKINRIDDTGDVIWRWGGKENQFTELTPDPEGPFSFQHDIRRLPNGNLTIFDNHNIPGGFSRAVEYQMDETAKVVTNTWEYRNNPDIFSLATGNNQRLPDGHRFIDWGFGHPSLTEVMTDGTKLFEMNLSPGYISYRGFRFPWDATPSWDPLLVLTGTTPTLYYSWNGATDVASYNIYGGVGPAPNVLLGNQPRTGFEDQTVLSSLPAGYCAFRVQPINQAAQLQPFSNVVYSMPYCPGVFFPVIFR